MIIPAGDYHYEIRRDGEIVAIEESRLCDGTFTGTRRAAEGRGRHEMEAALGPGELIQRVSIRYTSSLFTRNATYEAAEENLRGRVSALAGRSEVIVKLGHFREIEVAGFAISRAIIIAHVRARRRPRWTGRVAVIDPSTLVAASIKQNCAIRNSSGEFWSYEPRMGDMEDLEIDESGKLLRRRDNRGVETILMAFEPAG